MHKDLEIVIMLFWPVSLVWYSNTIGLYWDFHEHCWKCVICGHREYEHATRSKSKKELEQERLLEQVMDSLD